MKYIKLTDAIKAAMQTKFLELMNNLTVVESDVTVKMNTKELISTEGVVKPTIIIEEEASKKLWAYVDLCDKEIGWHGTVIREDVSTFRITDVFLFPQTVTAATVTTDDDKYSTWILSQEDEVFNTMRFHGHSHVNMQTGASGVDTQYQYDLLRDVKDFYIFGIFNKRRDINFFIYDIVTNLLYEKDDIIVVDYSTTFDDNIELEIEEYVSTPPKVVTTPNATYSYGNNTVTGKACPPDGEKKTGQTKGHDYSERYEEWAERYYGYGGYGRQY